MPGIMGGIVQNVRMRQAGAEHDKQTQEGGEDRRGRAVGIQHYEAGGGGG